MDPRARRHFEAIAKAFAADGEARLREALERTQLQRMSEGYELGKALASAEAEAELEERARAQAQLHARARRLRVAGL